MPHLDDFRAFFRTHELSGMPTRKPAPDYAKRVPLNCIIAFTDAVGEVGDLNDRQRQYLDAIRATASKLLHQL